MLMRGVDDGDCTHCSGGVGHDGDGSLAQRHGPLKGSGRPDLVGLFDLPTPHNAPFLRMLDCPAVIHRLNWILGAGYVATQNTAICSVQGSSGQRLHAGGAQSNNIRGSYSLTYVCRVCILVCTRVYTLMCTRVCTLRNGRIYVGGSINVAFQLHDNLDASDGGFAIVTGSHKSSLPLPERVQWCEDLTSVRHVPTKAGDVILFLGSGVTHGALAWKSQQPRRVAMLSYFSKYTSLFGAKM